MNDFNALYQYAFENDIYIGHYPIGFAPAVTMRVRGCLGVFFDLDHTSSISELNSNAAHEHGHCATGALHQVDSPYEVIGRMEHKANRWAYEHTLPLPVLLDAMQHGNDQVWQLAELLGYTEQYVAGAIKYYKECRGVTFAA